MTAQKGERSRDMKRRIIDASVKLFEERGYDAVTVAEIAKAAGCSPGNLYHYFKGKEELRYLSYKELDAQYEKTYRQMKKRGEFLVLEPELRLVSFLLRVVELDLEEPSMRYMYRFALLNQGLDVKHDGPERSFRRICMELIEAMFKKGRVQAGITADRIYFELLTLSRGILLNSLFMKDPYDIMDSARIAYLRFLLSVLNEEAKG